MGEPGAGDIIACHNLELSVLLASGPITSWEIDGETVEIVSDFIFLGSKITADGDCSHEIKRRLLLGRKVMTNLDSIFKSRDVTFQFSASHCLILNEDLLCRDQTRVSYVSCIGRRVLYHCATWEAILHEPSTTPGRTGPVCSLSGTEHFCRRKPLPGNVQNRNASP